MIQLGLIIEELFEQTELLQKKILAISDSNPIDIEKISQAIETMEKAYLKSIKNDPGLKDWLGAELNRIKQQHKSIQKRIEKTKKSAFDGQLKKVAKLKENLFPNQKLQERTLNLLVEESRNRFLLYETRIEQLSNENRSLHQHR